MATHSSILAWKIPWTEEPGRLQFTKSDTAEQPQQHIYCSVPSARRWESPAWKTASGVTTLLMYLRWKTRSWWHQSGVACALQRGSVPRALMTPTQQVLPLSLVALSFCIKGRGVKSLSHSVVSNPLQPHGLQSARLLYPWDFPGKSTGRELPFTSPGDHSTQGSDLGLPH